MIRDSDDHYHDDVSNDSMDSNNVYGDDRDNVH